MIIALDIDGVLRDTYPEIIKIYKHYYPNVKIQKRTNEVLNHKMFDLCINYNGLKCFKYARPIAGAKEFVKQLTCKHTVVYVTAQETYNIKYTLEWLEDNDMMFKNTSLFFTKNKGLFYADILLDDFISNLRTYTITNPNGLAVCYTQSWNTGWKGYRVKNYSEFIKLL